ncbi:hypothetical protein HMPREF3189_01251 [Clostridiales bacterium KA00134]|nr:hypothetical protein HMPREF3189_01251 [Clostridiales bacterium KA00134]
MKRVYYFFGFILLMSIIAGIYYPKYKNKEIIEIENKKLKLLDQENYGKLCKLDNFPNAKIFADKDVYIFVVDGFSKDKEDKCKFFKELKKTGTYFKNYYQASSLGHIDDVNMSILYSIYPRVKSDNKNIIAASSYKSLATYLRDMSYESAGFLPEKDYLNYEDLKFDILLKHEKEILNFIKNGNKKKFLYANFKVKDSKSMADFDKQMQDIISNLKEHKKLNSSLIIFLGASSKKANEEKDENLNMPLVMTSCPAYVKNDYISNLDLLPTILGGMQVKEIYPFFGKSIFSKDFRALTILKSYKKREIYSKKFKISSKACLGKTQIEARDAKGQEINLAENEVFLRASHYMTDLSEYLTSGKAAEQVFKNRNRAISFDKIKDEFIIMHAGGEIAGISYCNLKEAIDKHYDLGKRYFELDFQRSKDGKIILLHDFGGFVKKFFEVKEDVLYSEAEFMNFKSTHGYKQMNIYTLKKWLENHKDAYIVTDMKNDNIAMLKELKEKLGNAWVNILPQVYSFKEYQEAKNLGFEKIILTMYKLNEKSSSILNFIKREDPFAITMNVKLVDTYLGQSILKTAKRVFVHTVNDKKELEKLKDMGVDGFYTDRL